MKTFLDQFNANLELVRMSFSDLDWCGCVNTRNAYDDLSGALGLSSPAIALMAWALYNMGSKLVYLNDVASQIGFPEKTIESAVNELVDRHYMEALDGNDDCLDFTSRSKEILINHYCFNKLMND